MSPKEFEPPVTPPAENAVSKEPEGIEGRMQRHTPFQPELPEVLEKVKITEPNLLRNVSFFMGSGRVEGVRGDVFFNEKEPVVGEREFVGALAMIAAFLNCKEAATGFDSVYRGLLVKPNLEIREDAKTNSTATVWVEYAGIGEYRPPGEEEKHKTNRVNVEFRDREGNLIGRMLGAEYLAEQEEA